MNADPRHRPQSIIKPKTLNSMQVSPARSEAVANRDELVIGRLLTGM